jgi:hypothetical protein
VELLALMQRLWLAFGSSITELISVNMVVAELPLNSLSYATMIGRLEVTQKEDRSTQLGGLHRKPQAMVRAWALFASL